MAAFSAPINSCDSGLWTKAGGKVKDQGEDTTSKLDREVQKWMSGNSTLSFQKDPEQSNLTLRFREWTLVMRVPQAVTSCHIMKRQWGWEEGPCSSTKGPRPVGSLTLFFLPDHLLAAKGAPRSCRGQTECHDSKLAGEGMVRVWDLILSYFNNQLA